MHRSPYTPVGILVALSVVLLVVQVRVFDALMYFLFAGVIPGTPYVVPPVAMLLLTASIGSIIIARISSYLADTVQVHREAQKILERAGRLPRRRYQRG